MISAARWLRAILMIFVLVAPAGALSQTAIQPSAQSATTTPGVKVGQGAAGPDGLKPVTRDDELRGGYGPYRANNDLLLYHLDLRIDPVAEMISGSNTVRFRMLADGDKIQLDLTPTFHIEGITFEGKTLTYTQEERAIFISLGRVVRKGEVAEVTVRYSGKPVRQGRFGCFSFDKDAAGKPWITTACEGEGASVWWPNKDQWRDEPQDGMEIDVAVPTGLMDVSNGRFVGSQDLGDGYTKWMWRVHYPINNYDVALNIGDYQHWSDVHKNKETGEQTTLDFYALPEHLEGAHRQFAQVPEMLDAYEHYFGEYPWDKDGYKLVDVPYAGMEHQSAVAYGNRFANGYYGRDWTGVGISPKFDFIIIHESGHEWFGNAVTAADVSDMWIHEGWTTYLEVLYVEYRWGKADAIRYANGLKAKVHNQRPIITEHGVNQEPPQDQYFKGALMINTLRSVIDDDAKWFADIKAFYQQFKYQDIMTEDVVAWWNKRTGLNLTPFFDEYLRHKDLPVLELKASPGKMEYRWKADEAGFAMPIKVGDAAKWTVVTPVTTEWRSMAWSGTPEEFKVATDLYYVAVTRDGVVVQ
jgi:aminopeptidase N